MFPSLLFTRKEFGGAALAASMAAGGGAGLASWAGPAIAGGAGVLSSAIGALSSNQMNLANRTWSAQQAALQRDWATQQQLQAEQYNTQMADTAMQRRVADLKAAGLNPALAVPQGASTPMMSAPSGASAQSPQTYNPGAALGGLSGDVTSALALHSQAAQIDALKAQAYGSYAKAASDAATAGYTSGIGTEKAAQDIQESQARTAIDRYTNEIIQPLQQQSMQAGIKLTQQQTENAEAELRNIKEQFGLIKAKTVESYVDQQLTIWQTFGQRLSNIEQMYLLPRVIQQAGVQLGLDINKLPQSDASAKYWSTQWGQETQFRQDAQSIIGTGLDVYKAFKPGGGLTIQNNPRNFSGPTPPMQ